MNANERTQEIINGNGTSSKDHAGRNNQEPSMYVVVIGPQSPHSLQHLAMLGALYGWDLLVMAEHGHSVVTSATTMRQSTSDLVRILEER